MSLGTETAGALSLTQAELSNLVTTGPVAFGNSVTGAFTIGAPITAGSSSVSISSGGTFTVSPGASLTTAVPLTVNAPSITVGGAVNAQQVNLTTDTAVLNAPVTSTGDINLSTRTFGRAVNLGSATDGATSLDLSQGEMNNLVNGAANALRVNTPSGTMTVQSGISRVGQGALALTGSTLGQATGATITADNLRLNFTTVNLPEANNVTNLAGSVISNLTLSNAATLNIATVDGTNGLFATSATIMADDFNATSVLSGTTHTLMSRPAAPKVLNLGGAPIVGQFNVSATDLANTRGIIVNLVAQPYHAVHVREECAG